MDKLLTAFNDSDEEVTAEETEKKNEASGSVATIKPFSLAPQAESKDPSSEEKKAATPGFSFGAPKSDPKPKSTETADPAPKGPDNRGTKRRAGKRARSGHGGPRVGHLAEVRV